MREYGKWENRMWLTIGTILVGCIAIVGALMVLGFISLLLQGIFPAIM